MAKQSGLDKAIEKINAEIAVLEAVRERLEAERSDKPAKAPRKAKAKKATEPTL